jgi:hypothetical protein
MRGAPGGCGHGGDPKPPSFLGELIPKIDVPRAGSLSRHSTAMHDLRTNFITTTANPNPCMHYDMGWRETRLGSETLDSPLEDAAGGAPPACVQQRDPPARRHQVHRYTVGHGNGEQNPRCGRDPAIYSLDLHPATAGTDAHQLNPVYLIPERHGGEVGQFTTERAPPAHNLSNRFSAPESEVKPPTRLIATPGNTGHHSETFAPARNLESWNRARDQLLSVLLPHCFFPRLLPIHSLDLGTESSQPLIDPLVPALDLPDIVNCASAVSCERGKDHCHPCSYVG